MIGFNGRFPVPATTRAVCRGARRRSRLRATGSTSASDDFVDTSSNVIYHLDYPGRRTWLLPAVHGLRSSPPASQGRARRPGR